MRNRDTTRSRPGRILKLALLNAATTISRMAYFRGRDRLTRLLFQLASLQGNCRVVVEGFNFDLNLTDGVAQHLFLHRSFPGLISQKLRSFIHTGMTVVDIGANIGYVTMTCAQCVGPSGRVIAFEPAPRAFASLRENLKLNELYWVEAEPLACGDSEGTALLHLATISDEYNSLAVSDRCVHDSSVSCRIVSLDEYAARKRLDHIDVVKIDVEGAEWSVLKGMRRILTSKQPPLFVVEASARNAAPFHYTPADMFTWLADFGYAFHIISEAGAKEYSPQLISEYDRVTDVVCLPPGTVFSA